MAKKIDLSFNSIASIGTATKWYKSANVELLNNTGTTDIRLDKLLAQVSLSGDLAGVCVVGAVIHMTDETGADMSSSITAGTTDDAALETLLNQWKDNVFITDFRLMGTGSDEMLCPVIELSADTRRILKPGQKLYFILLCEPAGTETTKTMKYFLDSFLWYSAAAQ